MRRILLVAIVLCGAAGLVGCSGGDGGRVEVGDTVADPESAVALPRLEVDEPVIRMSFGVNTSPLAGRSGRYLTGRHLRDRLAKEVLGNVSIKVRPSETAEVLEVAGRGELQLAVLIESMRREGFELQVSRPEVVVREVDGAVHEPVDREVGVSSDR